jgi:hypothetical protein
MLICRVLFGRGIPWFLAAARATLKWALGAEKEREREREREKRERLRHRVVEP